MICNIQPVYDKLIQELMVANEAAAFLKKNLLQEAVENEFKRLRGFTHTKLLGIFWHNDWVVVINKYVPGVRQNFWHSVDDIPTDFKSLGELLDLAQDELGLNALDDIDPDGHFKRRENPREGINRSRRTVPAKAR